MQLLRRKFYRIVTTLNQAEVNSLRNNRRHVQSGSHRILFPGRHPRAGDVEGTQSGSVHEKHVCSYQQDPSGSPLSHPGQLGTSGGKKHNWVDPCMPWLERDFHFTLFVMDPSGLQEHGKDPGLYRAFEDPAPGDLPHKVREHLLFQ